MIIENSKQKTYFARKLRHNQTEPEQILWEKLRNRKFLNIKFRRQQAIGKYIGDFVSFEIKLIVELDGGHHKKKEYIEQDMIRSEYLIAQGFKVLRFWNSDVVNNLEEVLGILRQTISSPQPSPIRRGRIMKKYPPSLNWRGGKKGGEA